MRKRVILISFLLVFSHTITFGENKTETYQSPPLEAFAALPAISKMRLSPDGKYIAGLMNYKGKILLRTQKLYSNESHLLLTFDNKKFKLHWFEWANNTRLLVGVYFSDKRDNIRIGESRLLGMDLDGSNTKELVVPKSDGKRFKTDIGRPSGEYYSQFRDNVIDLLPNDPKHVLVSVDFEEPTFPSVYKLDVYTGRKQKIKSYQPPVRDWLTDCQGNVRVGYGYKDTDFEIIGCDAGEKKWRTLWMFELFKEEDITPLGFGLDPDILYIRALHQGKNAVFTVNLTEESLKKTLVVSDPDYDMNGGLIRSERNKKVDGIHYAEDASRYIYWDERFKAFQKAIDKALPDTTNYIINTSRDEKQYIVYSTSMFDPGTFYYGDLEKRTLDKIGVTYPLLNKDNLTGKKKITYFARDGLEITGYLTIPRVNHEKPYPTIIHPHGGPAARDYMAFDYWTEFFASRGYAVLQINFRGSGGYGRDFFSAGLKNWGLEMQDDITDGAQWLINEGIADPDRIAIVGASYGGYAALMGAVKTPDLYRCAVSFAGVSDLKLLLERSRHFTNRAIAEEQIGSRFEYGDQLVATSPARHTKKIKIPIFLAHGDDDLVVDIKHSERMVKALKEYDKTYEYLELEGGDHNLSRQDHRILFFERLDSFLTKHMK